MKFTVPMIFTDESIVLMLEALHQFNPNHLPYHLQYLEGRIRGEGLEDIEQVSKVVRLRDDLMIDIVKVWDDALKSKLLGGR